jgi:hypothetical protein
VPGVFGVAPFAQYRANGASNPLSNQIGTLPVWVTADPSLMGERAFNRAKPDEVYAGLDPDLTDPGDYLVGATSVNNNVETFFIASQDSPMPTRLVLCNSVLTISRPTKSAPGASAYGGNISANETPVMTGWPCSIIQGTKGEAGVSKLPGDVRAPWFTCLLPSYQSVQIKSFDIAVDAHGTRYVISSTELTAMGWRLTLSYAGT